MRFQGLKLLSEVIAKKEPGPASSINKMFWSEYARRFGEVVMNIRGMDATVMADQDAASYNLDKWQSRFLQTRSVTIWGGTAEVQRNIVGERVLGLPKEPSNKDSKEPEALRSSKEPNK
jgi:hypothetical protein